MSSKKGSSGGRQYSNAAPSMRRESAAGAGGGGSSSNRGGRGGGGGGRGGGGRGVGRGGARLSGMAAQAAVHGEGATTGKKRVRPSRAQNAFGYEEEDYDAESKQHQAQRYESEAVKSREYVLPENFEDEDLDSDEEGIFNEDDEIKYGDVFNKKKQSGSKAKDSKKKSTASTEDDEEAEVSGDAGSEEEEDVSGWAGAETIDLSDMIDWDDSKGKMKGDDEDEEDEEQLPVSKKAKKTAAAAAAASSSSSAAAASKGKKLTRKQQLALEKAEAEAAAAAAEAEEEDDAEVDVEEDEDVDDAEDDDEDREEDAEDEEISMDEEEDDDEDAGGDAHKNLLKFVQGLKSSEVSVDPLKDAKAKRAAASARGPSKGLAERTEAFPEGMFSIPKSAAPATPSASGLKLSDLLRKMPTAGEDAAADSSSLAALKKQLNVLSSSAHTKTLAEPLPEIRQDELTRALGYAQTKEEVARWTPLINRLRDAPSVNFPLNAAPRENTSSAALQTRFHASADSSLESDLASLMNSYGLKEKDLLRSESTELAASNLTSEEILKRNESLAKMKALLFYQEQKMARINRIKSKTYRRLKKKQREKGQLSLEEMKELDPESFAEEQRKMESKRIEERMSLSHSNSSKWMAKQLQLNRAQRNANSDIKDALAENNRIAQELRQKQESFPKKINSDGEEEEESEASEEEEEEEDQEDDDEEAVEARAQSKAASRVAELRAQLREMESSLSEMDASDQPAGFDQAPGIKQAAAKGKKDTGVLGLKFMQKAADKKRAEARAQIQEMEAELAQEEARETLRRKQRRAGEDVMDDEELDIAIASSMPTNGKEEHDAASKAAQLAGRKKVTQNSTRALVAAAPESSVQLLPNTLQSATTARGKSSKTRVDGPIAVQMPASVGAAGKKAAATAAAAAALAPKNAHPGQHHTVHGKSSVSVDTPFISAAKSEMLFPMEAFSSDEEEDPATAPNAHLVDLNKIKSDVRASLQASKQKGGKATVVVAREGGMDAAAASEDEDLDAGAGDLPAGAGTGASATAANPWAQSSAVNPRKAARQAAKAAKRQKTGSGGTAVSTTAAGEEDDEEDDDDAAQGASAIDMDLSKGGVSLKSKRSEFDLLSGGGMSQSELVRRAFSAQQGDEEDATGGVESAEAEFERLKRELTEEDLPKEDTPIGGLPGWVSAARRTLVDFHCSLQLIASLGLTSLCALCVCLVACFSVT